MAEAKTVYPRANKTQIKAKIGSLRSTFLRELKKIESSKRSGAAADDVYVPKLWYFSSLMFLKDQTEPRQHLSTFPSASAEATDTEAEPTQDEEEEEELSLPQV